MIDLDQMYGFVRQQDGYIATIVFVVVMLIGSALSRRQRAQHTRVVSLVAVFRDWTAVMVALASAVAFTLPVIEFAVNGGVVAVIWAALGLVLIALGWTVAWLANRAIAHSWSAVIDKTAGQALVDSGPYAAVRHPLYLSGLMLAVGANLYFGSAWGWLGLLVVVVAIIVRIPVEERRLTAQYGQPYVDYQRRTSALIPWLL